MRAFFVETFKNLGMTSNGGARQLGCVQLEKYEIQCLPTMNPTAIGVANQLSYSNDAGLHSVDVFGHPSGAHAMSHHVGRKVCFP